jgi:hypothetical protein
MYQGFSDALAQAVEIVVTPLLFAALGYWLDGLFGIRPVLTAVLGALGLVGVAARSYYAYKAAMDRAEEGKPWTRSRP